MLANATRVLPWREVTHCAFSHRGCLHWRIHTPLPCRARPQQGPHRYPRVHYLHLFLARMAHLVIPLLMPSVSPSSIFACFPHHPPVRSQPTRDLGLPPSPCPHPPPPPLPKTSHLCSTQFLAPLLPHSRLPPHSTAYPVDPQHLFCPLQAQGRHASAPGCHIFLPGRVRSSLDFLGVCVPPHVCPWIYTQLPPHCIPAPRTTLSSLFHLAHPIPPTPNPARFN